MKRLTPARHPTRVTRQSGGLGDLRRDHAAYQRERGKITRSKAMKRSHLTESGMTNMEKVVQQYKMSKSKPLNTEKKTVDLTSKTSSTSHDMNTKPEFLAERERLGRGLNIDEVTDDLSWRLPADRRWMEHRLVEKVHQKVLSTDLLASECNLDCDLELHSQPKVPKSFEDAEAYVQFWEPVVIAEFRAAIRNLVEQEGRHRGSPKSIEKYYDQRQSFVVEGAIESVGYVQRMSIRLGTDADEAQPRVQREEISFEMPQLQVFDVVLLHIPSCRSSTRRAENMVSQKALGIVVALGKRSDSFAMKLHVSFKHCSQAPTNGKRIELSRLTGLTTFQRQIEALWSLSTIPDGILWSILEPDRATQINGIVHAKRRSMYWKQASIRISFIENLLSKDIVNRSQAAAIKDVLDSCAPIFRTQHSPSRNEIVARHGSVTLIQGPPGTGKTSTILALLSAILMGSQIPTPARRIRINFDGSPETLHIAPLRVLVAAPSNAAVDEVMLRVMEEGLYTSSGDRASPRIIRVGGGTKVNAICDLELQNLSQRNTDYDRHWRDLTMSRSQIIALREELEKVEQEVRGLDKKRREHQDRWVVTESKKDQYDKYSLQKETAFRELTNKLTDLHSRKKQICSLLAKQVDDQKAAEAKRKRENMLSMCSTLNSASIVFSTLSSAGHDIMKKYGAIFDVVIVDEAAQCGEPEVLIPLTGNNAIKNRTSAAPNVVLIGDPQQLPATIFSTEKRVRDCLAYSLFERLGTTSNRCHKLNTQYRMHPDISFFPNVYFYDGLLQDGINVKSSSMARPFHSDAKQRFGPVSFLDTSHCCTKELRSRNGSLYNTKEANVIVEAVMAMLRLYGSSSLANSIEILSPYRQQVSVLTSLIKERAQLRDAQVAVNTIDGIQGRERSIIILSTVRSGEGRNIGFIDDDKRMNVALTRAKHSLIVVGNASVLSQHSTSWAAFLSYCKSRSVVTMLPEDPTNAFPEARAGAMITAVWRDSGKALTNGLQSPQTVQESINSNIAMSSYHRNSQAHNCSSISKYVHYLKREKEHSRLMLADKRKPRRMEPQYNVAGDWKYDPTSRREEGTHNTKMVIRKALLKTDEMPKLSVSILNLQDHKCKQIGSSQEGSRPAIESMRKYVVNTVDQRPPDKRQSEAGTEKESVRDCRPWNSSSMSSGGSYLYMQSIRNDFLSKAPFTNGREVTFRSCAEKETLRRNKKVPDMANVSKSLSVNGRRRVMPYASFKWAPSDRQESKSSITYSFFKSNSPKDRHSCPTQVSPAKPTQVNSEGNHVESIVNDESVVHSSPKMRARHFSPRENVKRQRKH